MASYPGKYLNRAYDDEPGKPTYWYAYERKSGDQAKCNHVYKKVVHCLEGRHIARCGVVDVTYKHIGACNERYQ